MKKAKWLSLFLLTATTLVGCSNGNENSSSNAADSNENVTLTVSSFGGTYDEVLTKYVVEPFENDHPNVNVELAPYTGVTKIAQGGAGNIDVIQLDDFDLIDAANQGYLKTINSENIPSLDSLYDQAKLYGKDENLYGIVNVFGAWGLAYNPEVVDQPTSWLDLSNQNYSGKVSLMSQWIPDILMIKEAVNSSESDMSKVWSYYEELTPSISQYYSSFSSPESLFSSNEIVLASWFDGRAYALKDAGQSVEFTIPKEGGILIRSGLGVLESSKNAELAMEFIEYTLKTEAQIGFAEELYYGPTNEQVELPSDTLVVYGKEDISQLIAPDWNEILGYREEWLLKWTEVTTQ